MTNNKPSEAALNLAETLVNHQFGVSVHRLALALDDFRAAGIRQTIDAAVEILHDEGWYGYSKKRISQLPDKP